MQEHLPTAQELVPEATIPNGEKLRDALETEAAGDETFALAADPVKPLQHGVDHLKSRLVIACTAWNNTLGSGRGEELLITHFMDSNWETLSEKLAVDVKADADNLQEVIWKPISYLINEVITGKVDTTDRKYAAVLVTGQYMYLEIRENNFYQINGSELDPIPAHRVIMIRETFIDIAAGEPEAFLDNGEYVRAVISKGLPKVRYALKEQDDKRAWKKQVDKRRKANKVAKAQKKKSRK